MDENQKTDQERADDTLPALDEAAQRSADQRSEEDQAARLTQPVTAEVAEKPVTPLPGPGEERQHPEDVLDAWVNEHIRNSVIANDVHSWNHFVRVFAILKERLRDSGMPSRPVEREPYVES